MASVAEATASRTFRTYLAGGLTVIVESAFLPEGALLWGTVVMELLVALSWRRRSWREPPATRSQAA
jgi:hypothetical protein